MVILEHLLFNMNVLRLQQMCAVLLLIFALVFSQSDEIHQQGQHSHFMESDVVKPQSVNHSGYGRTTSSHCSTEKLCSCRRVKGGGVIAQCSNLGLKIIPEFTSDVVNIDLSRNFIQQFVDNSVITTKSISKRRVDILYRNPFKGLNNLTKLDLSGNLLDYSPEIFKKGIFCYLKNLKSLNLQGNNQNISQQAYPREIAEITMLEELYLDGLANGEIPEEYSGLTKLNHLDFSGEIYDNCHLRIVHKSFFANVPNVQVLNLSWCDLHDIEKGAIRQLASLTYLNIGYNNYLGFKILRNLTFDIQFTKIKYLILRFIHCPAGVGSILFRSDIEFLSNTSLVYLDLGVNRLQMLEDNFVKMLPESLEAIDLSANNIGFLTYKDMISILKLPNIIVINSGEQGSFRQQIRVGNMVNCHDWRGPYPQMQSENRKLGVISKNISKRLLFETNDQVLNINVSKSLQKLYLQKATFKDNFNIQLNFSKDNNIQYINFQGNIINEWNLRTMNLHKLQTLNIGNLGIMNLSIRAFDDLPSLQYLDMSDNFIGHVLSSDVQGNYFKNLNNLTHLQLQNNGLGHAPIKLFHGLPKLKVLNLRLNALFEWNTDIGHMTQLELLDLSQNRIQTLNKITRDEIETIAKTSNITINLKDNSLQCGCQTREFLKWIYEQKKRFQNFESYTCFYNNHYVVSFKDIEHTMKNLEKDCGSYLGVIVGTLVIILIIISIIVGAVIFRFRWKLRYLYFMAKKGHRQLGTVSKTNFEFDAFMSYANEDGYFVERETVSELEEKYGLRMIIHRRDFTPGHAVDENITDSIHKSKKTIVVLSSNYLKSYWCMFEFNMARMESIYSRDGEPTIFIAMLETLKPRDIPLTMMDMIGSDTYMDVPEVRNEEFWENFYKALTI